MGRSPHDAGEAAAGTAGGGVSQSRLHSGGTRPSWGVRTSSGHLTAYGLFLFGAGAGVIAGLSIKAFKSLLYALLHLVWGALPAALERCGWTYDSPFSLANYVWIVGALLGALVGCLSVPLLDRAPAPTVGAWVRYLHRSPAGTVQVHWRSGCGGLCCDWVGGFVLLVVLTALSGASFGPEPLVVVVPSAIAGSIAAGPLRQPARVARAAALAGGAGGLSAFFGLPVASAFAVLELPHVDGMQFASEALPACMAASLSGALFGDSIWRPEGLLGHSVLAFPGGRSPAHGVRVSDDHYKVFTLLWAAPVGLAAGAAVHCMVLAVKALHPFFHRLRHGHVEHGRAPGAGALRARRAAILAAGGALNGALALALPGALFWGEEQMQVALTRGCASWPRGDVECEPAEIAFLHPGLLRSSSAGPKALVAPLSGQSMAGLAAVKFVQIFICELSGFVGGAIYPTVFATAALGSAIGASPGVMALGDQYVMVSTTAAIAVGLSALLNTPFFAIFFVLVLQAHIPHGSTSAQLMTMLFAVCCHYTLVRPLIHRHPEWNMVATQQPRWDMKYVLFPWDTPPKHEEESDAPPERAVEDVEVGMPLAEEELPDIESDELSADEATATDEDLTASGDEDDGADEDSAAQPAARD